MTRACGACVNGRDAGGALCRSCAGAGRNTLTAADRERLERAGQGRLFGSADRCWCGDAHRVHPECDRGRGHGPMRRDLTGAFACSVCNRAARAA